MDKAACELQAFEICFHYPLHHKIHNIITVYEAVFRPPSLVDNCEGVKLLQIIVHDVVKAC